MSKARMIASFRRQRARSPWLRPLSGDGRVPASKPGAGPASRDRGGRRRSRNHGGCGRAVDASPGRVPPSGVTTAGTVVIEATLDSKGEVSDARVLSGPDELRRAVLQSVLRWHYAERPCAASFGSYDHPHLAGAAAGTSRANYRTTAPQTTLRCAAATHQVHPDPRRSVGHRSKRSAMRCRSTRATRSRSWHIKRLARSGEHGRKSWPPRARLTNISPAPFYRQEQRGNVTADPLHRPRPFGCAAAPAGRARQPSPTHSRGRQRPEGKPASKSDACLSCGRQRSPHPGRRKFSGDHRQGRDDTERGGSLRPSPADASRRGRCQAVGLQAHSAERKSGRSRSRRSTSTSR